MRGLRLQTEVEAETIDDGLALLLHPASCSNVPLQGNGWAAAGPGAIRARAGPIPRGNRLNPTTAARSADMAFAVAALGLTAPLQNAATELPLVCDQMQPELSLRHRGRSPLGRVHISMVAAMATRVGIRELRAKLASHLESATPIEVTRHGRTIGLYVPLPQEAEINQREDLLAAGRLMQAGLERVGLTEEELSADSTAWRQRGISAPPDSPPPGATAAAATPHRH